jgi:uncharacterized protein (TIGR00725 family)
VTPPYVAVVGPGEATGAEADAAERIGRTLAEAGAFVVCGGMDGVMAAACRGAASVGGLSIGLRTWEIDGIEPTDSPEAAAARALELVRRGPS